MREDLDLVEDALAELVEHFQDNSFDFLYESALQARLYGLIVDRMLDRPRIAVPGGYHDSEHYGNDGRTYIETLPVHSEYPYKKLFDIAILDRYNPEGIEDLPKGTFKTIDFGHNLFG